MQFEQYLQATLILASRLIASQVARGSTGSTSKQSAPHSFSTRQSATEWHSQSQSSLHRLRSHMAHILQSVLQRTCRTLFAHRFIPGD